MGVSIWEVLLFWIIPIGVSVWAGWRILIRLGYSGWWACLALVWPAAIVGLVVLSRSRWPLEDRAGGAVPVGTAPTAVAAPCDVIAEIERLTRLKASGGLSEPEFEAMKARALGGGGAA